MDKLPEIPMSAALSILGVSVQKTDRRGWAAVTCPVASGNEIGVHVEKGRWRCFHACAGCSGYGDAVDLYALFSGHKDFKANYRELANKISGGHYTPQEPHEHKAALPTATASAKQLNAAYSAMLASLTLSKEHRESLVRRGLTDAQIEEGKYKSLPSSKAAAAHLVEKLRKQGININHIPGFYCKNGHSEMAQPGSGFLIPYFNRYGQIVGMQIRFDDSYLMTIKDSKKRKKARYRWFTSSYCDSTGSSPGNPPFCGVPGTMINRSPEGSPYTVYATEGALKANVARCLDRKHHAFVAIPGVTCYASWKELLDHLKRIGVQKIIDAFDADRATNADVNEAIKRLMKAAQDAGFETGRLLWKTNDKGVDDFLLSVRSHK